MNPEARITVDLAWSAPDTDLVRSKVLNAAEISISQAPSVLSIKTLLISEHRATIRIESHATHDQLALEISSAFGPGFELQQLTDDVGNRTRFRVIPRRSQQVQDPPVAPALPQVDAVIPQQSKPATVSGARAMQARVLGSTDRMTALLLAVMSAVAAFAAVYYLLLRQLVGSGAFPNATDSFAHLFRAAFVASEWRLGNLFPLWNPGWYMGTPLVQYYPPLVTMALAPLTFFGGISFAYVAFTIICFGIAAISVALLFRSIIGAPGALVAGIVYPLSPFVLRTVFAGGALPATLIVAIQPVLLWVILDLVRTPTRRRFILVVVVSALAILAHHLLAVMFISSIGGGLVLLAIVRKNRRMAVGLSIAAIAIGIGLTSAWLFSAQTSFDFENVPKQHGPEPRYSQSRSFEIFSTGQRDQPGDVYLGLGMLLLGVGGFAVANRRDISVVLVGATGVSLFMMFGMNNPVILNGPVLEQFVFFERFLLTTSLALALLSGQFVSYIAIMSRRFSVQYRTLGIFGAVLLPALAAAVLLGDAKPHYSTLVVQGDDDPWISATKVIDEQAQPGRIADLVGRPEPAFFPYLVGRDAVTGWYLEGTSHWQRITLMSQVLANGHDRFVDRQLQQWWATGAYSMEFNDRATEVLTASGFEPLAYYDPSNTGITAWKRTNDASIINRVDRNAVTVGRAHVVVEVVFPWASQTRWGEFFDLADIDLDANRLLILAEANPDMLEKTAPRFDEFRQAGGIVLVVLGNDAGVWKANLNTPHIRFPNSFDVVSASGETLDSFSGLHEVAEIWEGIYVDDPRAVTLLSLEGDDGFNIPLLSRIDDSAGTIYVVGGALYNMVFAWPDRFSIDAVVDVLAREISDLVVDSGLTPLPAKILEKNSKTLKFEVENPGTTARSVISTTFAPHWKKALVDGAQVNMREYEGLVMLDLPPGSHTVELVQGVPPSYYVGVPITILIALGSALFIWRPDLLVLIMKRGFHRLIQPLQRLIKTLKSIEMER